METQTQVHEAVAESKQGNGGGDHGSKDQVNVTVDYLPATSAFHKRYPDTTVVEVVRGDAMSHFGVTDHQDRDTHRFFLEFRNHRITNTGQTLAELIGEHAQAAHFHLVEQITPGAN